MYYTKFFYFLKKKFAFYYIFIYNTQVIYLFILSSLMKNTIKNAAYATVGTGLLALNTANAIVIDSTIQATAGDNKTSGNFVETLNTMLAYVVGLLYFVAVVFALYGWFQILTAGWDEEKVKKGKTTLINAVIWLFIIFLASTIIRWVMTLWTTTIV